MQAKHKQSEEQKPVQRKEEINVQEYSSMGFTEPEQLSSNSDESLVDQLLTQQPTVNTSKNTLPGTTHTNNQPNHNSNTNKANITKQSRGARSSLQQNEQEKEKIRNELILEFKVSELQKICSTLTSANQKLLDKIQELQQENDHFKARIVVLEHQVEEKTEEKTQNPRSKLQDDNEFVESLNDSRESHSRKPSSQLLDSQINLNHHCKTEEEDDKDDEDNCETQLNLEEEVVDIEKMIKEYREELTKAEQIKKAQAQSYEENRARLEEELKSVKEKLEQTQAINLQLEEQLVDMQNKNQSLETEIQSILNSNYNPYDSERYFEDFSSRNRTESRSSQYITPVSQRHHFNRNNLIPQRPYYEDQFSHPNSHLDSSVQLELQKLIQKLVNELQHERNVKKRMTEEIKRIQKDLLDSEKEIMAKNKQIYQLEMALLKGQKTYSHNTNLAVSQLHTQINTKPDRAKQSIFSPSRDSQNSSRIYNSPNTKEISPKIKQKHLLNQKQKVNTSLGYSPSNRHSPAAQIYKKAHEYLPSRNTNISQSGSSPQPKLLQTFSLLQLLNEPTITLTVKEKLHICIKLVAFYEQKIYHNKNYKLLMLENVLVTNFNRINLRLIKIRVDDHKKNTDQGSHRNRENSKQQTADGAKKAIWNLGFLLHSLLVDAPTKEQDLGVPQAEKNLLQLIERILDNNKFGHEVLADLKQIVQTALQQRSKC